MESWPWLTVIPPSETCELFWAIFAFTTPFSSWNMVLQPNFFFTAFGTERSRRALTCKFFIICSCSIKVRQLQLAVFHHKKKHLKTFLGSAIWTYLKISFSLLLISKETLFPPKFDSRLVNKHWLANNMIGQADVRLCKFGGGWWLVKWMYQALLFSLSSQRSKKI